MISEEEARKMFKYYHEEWKRLTNIARESGEQKDWLNVREAQGCYLTMKQVLEV